jgi:signal transduction histidine kinase
MTEVAKLVLDFSGCDATELRTQNLDTYYNCDVRHRPEESVKFASHTKAQHELAMKSRTGDDADFEWLCGQIYQGRYEPEHPFFTYNGSFWTGDTEVVFEISEQIANNTPSRKLALKSDYNTLAIIPFTISQEDCGLFILKSTQKHFLTEKEVELYEAVAQTIGVGASCRRAQSAMRERVKELTCLYSIAKIAEEPGVPLKEMLRRIVEVIPSAWRYPELAFARLSLDDIKCESPGFHESRYRLASGITANGTRRGTIEIVYAEEDHLLDETPFLPEENRLLDAVAREIGIITETKEAEEDKTRLVEQLRHADRLATIGQFAAGVAHEINEPLGKILGFAQLAAKCDGLPETAGQDLAKIVKASLHARDIVKKLLIFTRQMPQTNGLVDLNKVVSEELNFFESQCRKENIMLVRSLEPDLPQFSGDPAQINQVLVNLVANAIHAMPDGGTLILNTHSDEEGVHLTVADTGTGMTEEVLKKIFIPFFTTKDVGKGTGLGMSVVHGIVTAHSAKIQVSSEVGQGTTMEVTFPAVGDREGRTDGQ